MTHIKHRRLFLLCYHLSEFYKIFLPFLVYQEQHRFGYRFRQVLMSDVILHLLPRDRHCGSNRQGKIPF